jgi:tyrosyl-tRNA synthetase
LPAEEQLWVCHLLTKIAAAESTSAARRLIEGGAVEIRGEKIRDPQLKVALKSSDEFIVKAGKKTFVKVKVL